MIETTTQEINEVNGVIDKLQQLYAEYWRVRCEPGIAPIHDSIDAKKVADKIEVLEHSLRDHFQIPFIITELAHEPNLPEIGVARQRYIESQGDRALIQAYSMRQVGMDSREYRKLAEKLDQEGVYFAIATSDPIDARIVIGPAGCVHRHLREAIRLDQTDATVMRPDSSGILVRTPRASYMIPDNYRNIWPSQVRRVPLDGYGGSQFTVALPTHHLKNKAEELTQAFLVTFDPDSRKFKGLIAHSTTHMTERQKILRQMDRVIR